MRRDYEQPPREVPIRALIPLPLSRLELARNAKFRKGSPGRAYLLRVPLDADGFIVPLSVRAMKAGAIDFIEKPFEKNTILAVK